MIPSTIKLFSEHSLSITDSALALMKSYLDGRQRCVQIDGVISEFAELACGVPQGSVLGPLKLCIYMLPLGSIMRHHDIDFHFMLMITSCMFLLICLTLM